MSEPVTVVVNRYELFAATMVTLLRALEEAGIIRLEGNYADSIRDGTAQICFPGESA